MTAELRETWNRLARGIAAGASPGELAHPARLAELGDAFGLTEFERDVLLLAAGCEVHPPLTTAIAQATAEVGPGRASPALALASLEDGHSDAFAPLSPLRAWLLIDVDATAPLLGAALHIDAAITPWLLGGAVHDPVIAALVADGRPAPDEDAEAPELADALMANGEGAPRLTLTGPDARLREQLACAVAARLGRAAWVLDGAVLPDRADDADALARRLSRAAALEGRVLMLDIGAIADPAAQGRATWFLHRLQMPVIVSGREPLPGDGAVAHEVEPPPVDARRVLWQRALGESAAELNGQVERLAGQFALGPSVVEEIARRTSGVPAAERGDAAWALARAHTRPALGELATPVDGDTDWDAIVLPDEQVAVLQAMCAQVRNRHVVYGTWAMATGSGRGLGITALFAGPSGTGKTHGRRGARATSSASTSTASTSLGGEQVHRRDREEPAPRVRRRRGTAARCCCSTRPTRCSASAPRSRTATTATPTSRSAICCSGWRPTAAWRSSPPTCKDALDAAFLRRLRFVVDFPFPDAASARRSGERIVPGDGPRPRTCDSDAAGAA